MYDQMVCANSQIRVTAKRRDGRKGWPWDLCFKESFLQWAGISMLLTQGAEILCVMVCELVCLIRCFTKEFTLFNVWKLSGPVLAASRTTNPYELQLDFRPKPKRKYNQALLDPLRFY